MPYPASDIDRPERLQGRLGSLWAGTYRNEPQVLSLLQAYLLAYQQHWVRLRELRAAVSRLGINPFRQIEWIPWTIREDELQAGLNDIPTYGEGFNYGDSIWYGTSVTRQTYGWPAPAGVVAVPAIFDGVHNPSRSFLSGTDYELDDDVIRLRANPFADPSLLPRPVLNALGEQETREITLWLFGSQVDHEDVYKQFGYVLQMRADNGQTYKDSVNAAFDALVDGSTHRHIESLLSTMAGIPLATGDETVQAIDETETELAIVTTTAVYRFTAEATPSVAVGDVLRAGQSLVSDFEVRRLGRGQAVPSQFPMLTLSRGFLPPGFKGELVWENTDVPLTWTPQEDGSLRATWPLSGWPGDIHRFFDLLHERGVAADETLANLLDTRSNKSSPPTAVTLPATINPLQFLCDNVLRENAILVRLRPGAAIGGVGSAVFKILRKLLPPHVAVLVLFISTVPGDSLTISDTAETADSLAISDHADTADIPSTSQESLRVRVFNLRCS